jgi:hypothetical protein
MICTKGINQIRDFLRKKLMIRLKKINSAENFNERIRKRFFVEIKSKSQKLKLKGITKFAKKTNTAKAVVCQLL